MIKTTFNNHDILSVLYGFYFFFNSCKYVILDYFNSLDSVQYV